MPRIEHIVKLGILKSAIKLKNSINWPATSEDIKKARKRLKYAHVKQWLELRSQGQGIKDFSRDKTGNVWLEEYNLLRPS